jgi:hypothetical protein
MHLLRRSVTKIAAIIYPSICFSSLCKIFVILIFFLTSLRDSHDTGEQQDIWCSDNALDVYWGGIRF